VSTIRLLTRIKPATTHKETLLTIDWEDITNDQLKVWATAHIISLCQAQWVKKDKKIPETFTFTCAEHPVHPVPMMLWMQEFSCPPAPAPALVEVKTLTKQQRWDKLFCCIAKLTPEEREKLFQ